MSILQNFFNARRMTAKPAAGAAGAAAPSAPSYAAPDPAAQFDKLIADYHSNYKALETEHPKIIQEIADTEQEYHRVYSMYISSKDNLAAAEGLLYNIKSENENLRHELATKERAVSELGPRVDVQRQNLQAVEKKISEERALFKAHCNELVEQASSMQARLGV